MKGLNHFQVFIHIADDKLIGKDVDNVCVCAVRLDEEFKRILLLFSGGCCLKRTQLQRRQSEASILLHVVKAEMAHIVKLGN